jgi:hypothetical protein
MYVPPRSRRRHHHWRMHRRMCRLWKIYFAKRSGFDPDRHWVAIMLSTHGKPCSCSMNCGNRRRWDGAPIAEQRRSTSDE